MADELDELRQRVKETTSDAANGSAKIVSNAKEPHPAGEVKHGPVLEALRALTFVTWFLCCAVSINCVQLAGAWLYWVDQDYYYAYMALTKQSFGIFITSLTQWFSPTIVRVSGDDSVRAQIRRTKAGSLELDFPERMIIISNHQIYTDWLYLWFSAYTARMHGHVYIILKESLKYVPVISPGILFYGFIFMARKWQSDQVRMHYRFQKLQTRHHGPMSGSESLDPMWLLLFPEGTNMSRNTRKKSVAWAEKQGIEDMKHQLLPRSTGFKFCLDELHKTVEWVYDCTTAYEGVPGDGYAPEFFTLRSTYLQGRPPKSVNMHWRRFAVKDIPFQNSEEFDDWVMQRWREKDELLDQFYATGRFPSADARDERFTGVIESEVRLRSYLEIVQIFMVLLALAMVSNVVVKLFEMIF